MGTIIKALNVDDFTTLIICFELSFGSLEHIEQIRSGFQIILFDVKAVHIAGFADFRAQISENRRCLLRQRSNSTNIHSNFLRQRKDISFLVGSEECVQRQRNHCINITLFKYKITQFFIVAAIHNTVRDDDKCLFPGFQGADDPLHKQAFNTHGTYGEVFF